MYIARIKKDKAKLKLLETLISILKKDWIGKKPCEEIHVDCAKCRAMIMLSYVEWMAEHYHYKITTKK
jgi:hypothetical protein